MNLRDIKNFAMKKRAELYDNFIFPNKEYKCKNHPVDE
jgi:hypothetical protein